LDAEVVRSVERARLRGRVSTPALYVRSTISQVFTQARRREPLMTWESPGEDPAPDLSAAIVQNTAPWTFLGDRAINPCSRASFDTGLDLMALRAPHLGAMAHAAVQILSGRPDPRGRHLLARHDLREFALVATRPLAFQLDGDFLGERSSVTFRAIGDALRVLV
jgi:diacylglycerol kinase family enzyme